MKHITNLLLAAMVVTAFGLTRGSAAENDPLKLSCWDINSPRGSNPVLTADIESNSELSHIVVEFAEQEPQSALSTSGTSMVEGTIYKRQPYGTVNEYRFDPIPPVRSGSFGRLLLPLDLSPEGLSSSVIPSQNQSIRRNGVFFGSDAENWGWVMHLHCISKKV